MQYYCGPLELRLETEGKLYHVAKKISSLIVSLSVKVQEEVEKLNKVMSLYIAYHSSGSAMEQSMIYEEFTKCVMTGE